MDAFLWNKPVVFSVRQFVMSCIFCQLTSQVTQSAESELAHNYLINAWARITWWCLNYNGRSYAVARACYVCSFSVAVRHFFSLTFDGCIWWKEWQVGFSCCCCCFNLTFCLAATNVDYHQMMVNIWNINTLCKTLQACSSLIVFICTCNADCHWQHSEPQTYLVHQLSELQLWSSNNCLSDKNVHENFHRHG